MTPLFLHGAASADMTGWSAVLSPHQDGLKDGLLSIPILFLAYLLMELLERSSRLNEGLLRRYSRRAGPALGGLLGIVPQCGISGAAATLFSTGSITVGTMLAVFFATSDEMLPILLSSLTESSGISWNAIVLITLSRPRLASCSVIWRICCSAAGSARRKASTASANASTATATKKRAACSSPPYAIR